MMIKKFLDSLPNTLSSTYSMANANESILLYQGNVATQVAGDTLNFEGSVSLNWLPKPQIRLACILPLTEGSSHIFSLAAQSSDSILVTLTDIEAEADVLLTNPSMSWGIDVAGEYNNIGLAGFLPHGTTFSSDEEVKSMRFHLPNFCDYSGARTKVEHNTEDLADDEELRYRVSFGRASFIANGWQIVLDKVANYNELEKQLRESNGYAITHIGQITREDNALFSVHDGEKILEAFAYFFSFCAGRWSCPLLISGFDENKNQVWTQWRMPQTNRWRDNVSCFSRPEAVVFNKLLPGFLKVWNNPLWQTPMRVVINWYFQSINPATIETGLVPPQIALEIIAWVLFVQVRQTMTKDEFENTRACPASKKIEMLLADTTVGLTIPSQQTDLAGLSTAHPDFNGPKALTWLRNGTAHGNLLDRLLSTPSMARYQGGQLGTWYLELVLLKLFDYDGRYFNRVGTNRMKGYSELVPWNASASTTQLP